MLKKIYENFSAFYLMTVSSTLLSNFSDEALDEDSRKVIDFIGKAYDLDEELIEYIKPIIIDELTTISLLEDVEAFHSTRERYSSVNEFDRLYAIKCDAILEIIQVGEEKQIGLKKEWFNYSHYKPYTAPIRFKELSIAASTGNILANRTVAILSYLGIGTPVNVEGAILRLKQCIFWGDIASIFLLSEIYEQGKDVQNMRIYKDLASLASYIEEGRTLIPENEARKLSYESRMLFAFISSIKQDIILNYQKTNIDYSFVEVMLLDSIEYAKKMNFINNYQKQEWKEITNSSGYKYREDTF